MEILTKEIFNKLENNKIFASGIVQNSPKGIFMNSRGGELKWVAKKELQNEWTIRYSTTDVSPECIGNSGRKVYYNKNIIMCVPCTKEVFELYKFNT